MSDLIEFKRQVKKLLCDNDHKRVDFSKILKVKEELDADAEEGVDVTPQMVYERLVM